MRIYLTAYLLLLAWRSFGQQGFPRYYEYLGFTGRADSLSAVGQFRQAALLYARAARVKVEQGILIAPAELHYQAAQAWARAGLPDSAFSELSNGARLGFGQADSLRRNARFTSLASDARWPVLLARVDANAARARHQEAAYRERTTFRGAAAEVVFSPPRDYLRQFIDNDTLPLVSVNYGNFRLFFRGNSYAATHLPMVKDQLAGAMTRILTLLHLPAYRKGIYLVLVDSKQELKELTGLSVGGGFALPGYDAVFLVNNPTRRLQAKHEVFHLIASEAWGITQSRLLNEGSAVYADNECWYENPIYGLNAYMLKTGKLLPVSSLLTDFDTVARGQEVAAYLQSAGLFKYLYEQYGVAKMKQLWVSGFSGFERIYGFPVEQLVQEWKSLLQKTPVPKAVDWEKLTKEGCG